MMPRRRGSMVGCGFSLLLLPAIAGGQWEQAAELLPADPAAYDWFGYSVAVSGRVAVVGADWDADNGEGSGSVYVFRRGGPGAPGWTQEAKLLASDGGEGDHFGHAVAISRSVIVVGAYLDSAADWSSGSAYVFRYNGPGGPGWVQETKLVPTDAQRGDMFGRSVSISENVVLISADQDDDLGNESGAAYVFRHNGSTWLEEAKLHADDGTTLEFFGRSVSVSGDVAVMGTPEDDDGAANAGSAYVFRYDGTSWGQEAKLLAGDLEAFDYFGERVSVSGDTIIVGADADDDHGPGSGAAYVYHYGGSAWAQQAKLVPADGAEYDHFGADVALSGDVAVVGCPEDDEGGSNTGSAYVYQRAGTSWGFQAKLLASDGAASDWLGLAVAVSGDTAVVGAMYHDHSGTDAGAAYAYGGTICGDADGNGTVDLSDYAIVCACLSGPGATHPPGCEPADCDGDGDVDLADIAAYQYAFQE